MKLIYSVIIGTLGFYGTASAQRSGDSTQTPPQSQPTQEPQGTTGTGGQTTTGGESTGTSGQATTTPTKGQVGQSDQSSQAGKSGQAAAEAPEGYVLIEEDVYTELQGKPLALLDDAQKNIAKNDPKAAAANIDAAAYLFEVQGKGAAEHGADLTNEATNLHKVADQVRSNQIQNKEQLAPELANAAYQSAKFHRLRAAEEWGKGMAKKTGHDLMAATDALEKGAEWTGKKAVEGGEAAIRGTRDVAGKLVKGTGYATAEVGDAIQKVGNEVDQLGKSIEPKERTAH